MRRITVFAALTLGVLGLISVGVRSGSNHQPVSRFVVADTGWPAAPAGIKL
jgi:hypothetical protein